MAKMARSGGTQPQARLFDHLCTIYVHCVDVNTFDLYLLPCCIWEGLEVSLVLFYRVDWQETACRCVNKADPHQPQPRQSFRRNRSHFRPDLRMRDVGLRLR